MSMKPDYMAGLWDRAIMTLQAARDTVSRHPDTAANRSYYAAFFAVSALFAFEDRFFKKHTATRSAVHKELIHKGSWPASLGDDYDKLLDLREVADYGVLQHASQEEAAAAIVRAERIIQAVHDAHPDVFKLEENSNND